MDCPERIHAGDDLSIGEYSFIAANGGLWIGHRVMIGHQVSILTADHIFERTDRPIAEQGLTMMPVRIGNDVYVGCGARLVGASIGDGAVVGAGAVVTQDVEPMMVVAGVPARVIRKRGA
ncbi:MAG: acyltransferase [Candidatus Latescibacterota bacterium]